MLNLPPLQYWHEETKKYNRPHPRLRQMARLLRRQPQRRLLDVGCSTAVLQNLLPPLFVYFGCDIAEHAGTILPSGHFLQVDFNRDSSLSAFDGAGIDVIHVGGVLEYLERPDAL